VFSPLVHDEPFCAACDAGGFLWGQPSWVTEMICLENMERCDLNNTTIIMWQITCERPQSTSLIVMFVITNTCECVLISPTGVLIHCAKDHKYQKNEENNHYGS